METLTAGSALITLPLGVLQSNAREGSVVFSPSLGEKDQAIRGLQMGNVVKLTFEFRSRFWPEPNFGFIHVPHEKIPMWWSDERGSVLTAWAGGAQADRLIAGGVQSLTSELLPVLGDLFSLHPQRVRPSIR